MKSRLRRMSVLSGASTLAVLVALAALAVLSARRGGRWDVTEGKRHSVRPQTQAILDAIPEGAQPVDIVVVTSQRVAGSAKEAEDQVRPLLNAFAAASPKVRTSVVLLERQPDLEQRLAIDRLPLVVASWQPPREEAGPAPERRERRTLAVTEASIAQLVRELVEDERRVAYFLVGHGELRIGERGGAGASLMAATLQGLNFETRELALAGTADIPQDADLLVIAGPQSDYLREEMAAIDRYQLRGGRFLVLDGPTRLPDTLQLLHAWLSVRWNVGALDGMVADFDVPLGADPRILLVLPRPEEHALLTGLQANVVLPAARGLHQKDNAIDGGAVTLMLRSGPRSWLETDLQSAQPAYDDAADLRGPLALAAAGTFRQSPSSDESRLVVVASRMAFADQYLGTAGNLALLRNAADWATGREQDITARSQVGADGTVVIGDRQGRIILGTMLVLPAIVAATGVVAWWRRRRL